MNRRTSFGVIGVMVALLAAGIQLSGLITQAELSSVDERFVVRGDRPVRTDIALVLVDDVTFSELKEQWPFPRRMHAQLMNRLRADGARLIAYDVSFDQPERGCHPDLHPDARACDGDAALLDAAAAARPAVFAVTASDSHGGPALFGGGPIIKEVGARPGTTLSPNDRGTEVRRMVWGDGGIPSFATAAAEVLQARQISPGEFPRSGKGLIAYSGGANRYANYSFSRVLRGRFAPGTFRDKTVIVGTEDPRLQDLHATPTSGSGNMSGAEIQANSLATLLNGFPLRQTPAWLDALLSALLGLVVPAAAAAVGFRSALASAGCAAVGWPLLVQWQFNDGTVLPLVAPLAGLTLGIVGTVATQAVRTSLEHALTRGVFERFVGSAVVDQVLHETGGKARLGGKRAQATVLFSDLRGFTTFAELLEPDEVIAVLNEYLTQMSDAILDHGGTLVSYMGDGIMAVFGAPLPQPDHADRAVAAAAEMVGPALARCNVWLRSRGHTGDFRMGVGLNSGTVMSGTVGSTRRMEYTALGDTTNAASRIEALTKTLGHAVVISEGTRAAATDSSWNLADLGEHAIRGRSNPMHLWALALDH